LSSVQWNISNRRTFLLHFSKYNRKLL
jgi:hypothetical protein